MSALTKALVATAAVICIATPVAGFAQPYPNRPIRLILPFPPGGPVDGFARQMGPKLTASFGQTIVLDNRPGAAGRIAIEAGARATPDGLHDARGVEQLWRERSDAEAAV